MRASVIVLSAALLGALNPAPLLREASSATSEEVCNGVFVTGLSADRAFALQMRPEPGMGLIAWTVHYDVDRTAHEVRTSVAGGFSSRAVYTEGRGCTRIAPGDARPPALHIPAATPPTLAAIAPAKPVTAQDANLRAAIDSAFAEPRGGPVRATMAVVVVHDGRVIGERYAEGTGIDTKFSGHSLAKSVVNAFVGILVRDGKLRVDARVNAPEWRAPNDPRAAITLENLLRMNAGFDFDEGNGSSTATHMWYLEPDIAHFAAEQPLVTARGLRWHYSSGSYAILSRVLRETIGDPDALNAFAHRELFDPLGMTGATIEFDQAGNMMGAHAVFASARDWARFGLLYLRGGAIGARRILPDGWVQWSTTPTGDTSYGAGFWLNTKNSAVPVWGFPWGLPGLPKDTFMGRGYMGQWIVIVPSEDLVVTRFGYSHGDAGDMTGTAKLVAAVIRNLHAR